MKIKEEYKIKYQELSLTGRISRCPKYIYEYYLPSDFSEATTLFKGDEEMELDYKIYRTPIGEYVLACNYTPLILEYKFEEV